MTDPFAAPPTAPPPPRCLLVVDDRLDVGTAYVRYFRRYFDAVSLAQTCPQAEALLAGPPPITHVLCDYWLGEGQPLGSVLIARWRVRFPCIQVALLVSGSEVMELQVPGAVDAVFTKPADLTAIRRRMMGD